MKKSDLSKGITVGVLLTIALFLLSWKIFLPEFLENKEELIQVESEVVAAREHLESLESAKEELDSLGEVKDKMLVSIPIDPDQPNLISELESIALANELVIPSIDMSLPDSFIGKEGTSSGASNYGEESQGLKTSDTEIMTISISVSGDFEKLNSFIAALEKNVRFFNINSLSYSSDEEAGIALAIQIQSFVQKKSTTSSNYADEEYLGEEF